MSLIFGILLLLLICAALTLWFFLKPRTSGGADLSLLRKNYAHHGLWDARNPEGSLDAILLAARLGYGVKLEVRATRERVLFVAGASPIPLSTVLARLDGSAPLMIEIGGKKTNLRLCLLLAKMLDSYAGPFAVISRDPKMIAWFKNYRPSFARGQIVAPHTDVATSHLLRNYLARPDFLVVEKTLRRRPSVLLLTRLVGLPCFIFIVGTTAEYRACRQSRSFVIFEKIRPRERIKKGNNHEQFYL
ncbi:MAG: hypothetical protein J6Q82_02015 [Clostridia bacterium]|nr:hypothetical protein [Clostridia bacterium]